MRGAEFITSTPKYILLYESFGWDVPTFIHLAPVMGKNEDGSISKLSKRHGATSFDDLVKAGYLPDAIAVREVKPCAPRFHARYNALGKTYRYTVFVGEVKPIFDRKYVTMLPYVPDVERMRQAAYVTGEHDFAAFCGNPRMKKSTVRTVDTIDIQQRKDRITFTFHGNGFLQNMVRILVGTLLEVGRGFWEPEQMQTILDSRDRKQAGPTAPPEGLCLMKVDY